jgi:hypothetical protein
MSNAFSRVKGKKGNGQFLLFKMKGDRVQRIAGLTVLMECQLLTSNDTRKTGNFKIHAHFFCLYTPFLLPPNHGLPAKTMPLMPAYHTIMYASTLWLASLPVRSIINRKQCS